MTLSQDIFGLTIRYRPLVSIDLVIRDSQHRLLVGLRENRPAQGTWFVPGGAIRKDERLVAAFERIARTELGVELAFNESELLGVFEHFYPDNALDEPGYGTHYVVIARTLTVGSDFEPIVDEQHSRFRWITDTEALTDPRVHENTKAYCRPIDHTNGGVVTKGIVHPASAGRSAIQLSNFRKLVMPG